MGFAINYHQSILSVTPKKSIPNMWLFLSNKFVGTRRYNLRAVQLPLPDYVPVYIRYTVIKK